MFTWYKSFRKKQFIKDVLPERTQNAMSYHLDPYLPNDVNIGSNSEKIWTNASSESNNVIREIISSCDGTELLRHFVNYTYIPLLKLCQFLKNESNLFPVDRGNEQKRTDN